MAGKNGRSTGAVVDEIRRQSWEFDFFQAVRVLQLQALQRMEADEKGNFSPVGGDTAPDREHLRFYAHLSFSYPPSAITDMSVDDRDQFDQMTTSFMSLVGANGVLPRHYTQQLLDQERDNDTATQQFYNLFHHRIVSLFYRAWEKTRFPFAWERSIRDPNSTREDLFTQSLYCLIGLGNDALRETSDCSSVSRNRLSFSDQTMLFFAGMFSHRPRTAISLQRMVATVFGVECEVSQYQGQWLKIDVRDQTLMPSSLHLNGVNNILGADAMIGDRVWNVESKIRITLGPLRYKHFVRFTPGESDFVKVTQFVRAYIGPELDFEVQPVLAADDVPPTQLLGGDDAAQLGWTTWVFNAPRREDAKDAVFSALGVI
jgi:type VI secretion system protein ImpH